MTIETVTLSNIQNELFRHRVKDLTSPYKFHRSGLLGKKLINEILDISQLDLIDSFTKNPRTPGTLFIDHIPVEQDYPTPENGKNPEKSSYGGEYFTLGLGAILGEPIGYLWEKDGEHLHHIVPYQGGEKTQSNQGSKVFLQFHNDTVYDRSRIYNQFNPDFLILTCVRPDKEKQAATRYADARSILAHFTEDEINRLRESRFLMASPSNYSRLMSSNGVIWSQPTPIIQGPMEYPEINMAANGVKPMNEKDQVLIDKIYQVANDPGVYTEVKLDSGQALIINNRKGIHARTPFKPSYDQNDRWLLRANVRCDLWSMRDKMLDGDYRRYA